MKVSFSRSLCWCWIIAVAGPAFSQDQSEVSTFTREILQYTQAVVERRQSEFGPGTPEYTALDDLKERLREVPPKAFEDETEEYLDIVSQELDSDGSRRLIAQTTQVLEADANWQAQKRKLESISRRHIFPKRRQTAEVLLEADKGLSRESILEYMNAVASSDPARESALPWPICAALKSCQERPPDL